MILEKNSASFFFSNMSTFIETAPKRGTFGQNREFLKIPRFPREQKKQNNGAAEIPKIWEKSRDLVTLLVKV